MIDRFEILAARLRRMISRSRWTARMLGLPSARAHASTPGLVLIQIDGLGEETLRRAIVDGRMPFLAGLLDSHEYELMSMYSGLPSATPAVQAELFYGERTFIPAFAYRDADLDRIMVMNFPSAASVVEASLREGREGLLRGGSAWSDLFTGEADDAHMCASSAGVGEALRALEPRRFVGALLWHFWSVVRVLANGLITIALMLWDLLRGDLSPRQAISELRHVPLRVAVDTALREVITAGAAVDIERGLPVVHVNYLGYDENAHRRGPDSRFATWSLRGIDRSIRRLWLAAKSATRCEYHLCVYSDHGQERVERYESSRGETVEEVVARVLAEQSGFSTQPASPPWSRHSHRGHTLSRAGWMGFHPPGWERTDALSHVPPAGEDGDVQSRSEIEVVAQAPVALVYARGGLDADRREALAQALVRNEGIPFAAFLDGADEVRIVSPKGSVELSRGAVDVFGADHPHLDGVVEDLERVVRHESAGELLLFGWRRERPLTFQDERGSHGGPGARETAAFAMLPPCVLTELDLHASLRPATLRTACLRALGREERVDATPRSTDETYRRRTWSRDHHAHHVEDTSEEGSRLRVMTYNVHGCLGMDGVRRTDRIARVIARESPDVVLLQEIYGGSAKVEGHVATIAERLGMEYHFHGLLARRGATFGSAICSRHPIRPVRDGRLPVAARAAPFLGLEPRGISWAAVQVDGRSVQVLNTHLSILRSERHRQAAAVAGPEWLEHEECRGPVVLAGDMNSAPHSFTLSVLERRLANAVDASVRSQEMRTWSGRMPWRRIDHVLVSDEVDVQRVYVPRTRLARVASDHLPLVADLLVRRETADDQRADRVCRVPEESS